MHKKIMKKAAHALDKDAAGYAKKAMSDKAKHMLKRAKKDKVEEKEARSASKDLKKRAKKAHE